MESEDLIAARDLIPGDVIFRGNEWRRVTSIWLHPNSCYNKIHTVRENEPDNAIALYEKVPLDFIHRRKSVQATKHVHFCTAISEMVVLKAAIEEYSKANELPERVKLENCNFAVDSDLVRRQCHETMMASFNRLKNAVNAVQKP